jgi:hypothetical protein
MKFKNKRKNNVCTRTILVRSLSKYPTLTQYSAKKISSQFLFYNKMAYVAKKAPVRLTTFEKF